MYGSFLGVCTFQTFTCVAGGSQSEDGDCAQGGWEERRDPLPAALCHTPQHVRGHSKAAAARKHAVWVSPQKLLFMFFYFLFMDSSRRRNRRCFLSYDCSDSFPTMLGRAATLFPCFYVHADVQLRNYGICVVVVIISKHLCFFYFEE